jgi:hypothetical protein
MEELSENMKRSLRRWWTLKERAGGLSPKESHIADKYFSQYTEIALLLPFPSKEVEEKKTKKDRKRDRRREERLLEYYKDLVIDPKDYYGNIHKAVSLGLRGRTNDWRNNTLVEG